MNKQKAPVVNTAHVTPAIVDWAVKQSEHTREDIASALDVAVDVLSDWEGGKSLPTFDQAVRLADFLAIPFGYLFLANPPIRKLPIPDKRTLGISPPLSANFRELLTEILIRQDWYRQHVAETGGKPLPFVASVSTSDDPVRVAMNIRQTIKLSDDDKRKGVYNWSDYVARVSERVEDAGIMVMRSGVVGNRANRTIERTEVQGFALADPLAPVIFVNASDFVAARTFTLAHELAHIWLGQSAISNPNQGESRSDAVETFCDKVATEMLVPSRTFPVVWRQTDATDRVDALAKYFRVSSRVIVRRARELNLISFDEYHALREKALAAETAKQKVRTSYYITAVARAGRRLTDAVLSEVAKGSVPIAEGASLLSMSLNTFAGFAEGNQ